MPRASWVEARPSQGDQLPAWVAFAPAGGGDGAREGDGSVAAGGGGLATGSGAGVAAGRRGNSTK